MTNNRKGSKRPIFYGYSNDEWLAIQRRQIKKKKIFDAGFVRIHSNEELQAMSFKELMSHYMYTTMSFDTSTRIGDRARMDYMIRVFKEVCERVDLYAHELELMGMEKTPYIQEVLRRAYTGNNNTARPKRNGVVD